MATESEVLTPDRDRLRYGLAVEDRLLNQFTSLPLNGIYHPWPTVPDVPATISLITPVFGAGPAQRSEQISVDWFVFPYGDLLNKSLRAFEKGKNKRCDLDYTKSFDTLLDILPCLFRSLQNLHNTNNACAELLAVGRPAIALCDLFIYIDATLMYLRIIADCIASTAPTFFSEPPYVITRKDFRKQRAAFQDDERWQKESERFCLAMAPLRNVYLNRSTRWFDDLSGEGSNQNKGMPEGLRNVRLHGRGSYAPMGTAGPLLVLMRTRNELHPIEVTIGIQRMVSGLFEFMDAITKQAYLVNSDFLPSKAGYSPTGLLPIPVIGSRNSLRMQLPWFKSKLPPVD